MDEFPVLETEHLILREFHESDAQAVFDIFTADWKGQFHDLRCFSLLRREWMARR